MRRFRPAFLTLATFLAVLLPLEQSHCAWMAVGHRAPSAARAGAHACCRHQTAPAPSAECACVKLPLGSLPSLAFSIGSSANTGLALPSEAPAFAFAAAAAPAPALDIGSPPLLIDLGAHGLRAPPRSA